MYLFFNIFTLQFVVDSSLLNTKHDPNSMKLLFHIHVRLNFVDLTSIDSTRFLPRI